MVGIAFLRKRYELKSNREVVDIIKENLEQINYDFDHAKTVNGIWQVDEDGVHSLDVILSYVGDDNFNEDNNLDDDESDPSNINNAMKKAKETPKDDKDVRIEQLESRLKSSKSHFNEQLALRDNQIAHLEKQIEEYQLKIDEYTELLEEKTKAAFDVLQAKKTERKLYSELRKIEKEKSDLSLSLASANSSIDEAGHDKEKLINDISIAIKAVSAAMLQLQKSVNDSNGNEVLDDSVVEESAEEQNKTSETADLNNNVTVLDEHRNELIEKHQKQFYHPNVNLNIPSSLLFHHV